MSEYNPFEDSIAGKGLHEINNAPKETASAQTASSTANPPYVPPVNPPYEPYIPTPAIQQQYHPTPPPGSSIHYSAGQSAYAGAPAARYDLAGNPLPPEPMAAPQQYAPPQSPYGAPPPQQPYGYAGDPAYGGAQAPYGAPQAPYGAPQGAWPPPPGQTGSALFDMQAANTSGQQGDVPAEIEQLHWNWGAYFLPILWCRWHGMTGFAGLLSATAFCVRLLRYMPGAMHPVFYATYSLFWLSVSIYMGLNGHKMAWRNRRYFGGVAEHLQVQRAWLVGGALAGPILSITAIVFFVSLLIASRPSPSIYGSGSSYNSPAGGGFGDGSTANPQGFNDGAAPQPGFTGDSAPPPPSFNGGAAPQPSFNGPSNVPPPPTSGVPTD
jgi:hypothetical protein